MEIRSIVKAVAGLAVGSCAAKVARDAIVGYLPEIADAIPNIRRYIGLSAISGIVGLAASKWAEDSADAMFELYDIVKAMVEDINASTDEEAVPEVEDDELKAKINAKAEELRRAIEEFNSPLEEVCDGGASDAGEDVPAAE